MKKCLFLCLLLYGCSKAPQSDSPPVLTSMQVIDRNGFTETISNKDRLKPFQATDFFSPQPYQKVLRVFAHAGKEKQSLSKITSYHPNGQVWQYLEVEGGRAHGAYREWFANGKKRIEASLLEGLADISDLAQSSWVFEGKSTVWDDLGGMRAEFSYDKGILCDASFEYYPSGKVFKTIPYLQGLAHGSALTYDEEGRILETTEYLHGKKDGLCTAFWEVEKPRFREEYIGDLLETAVYYSPQGRIVAEIKGGRGKQAQFQGPFLESLISYEKGIPCGLVEVFHPSGILSSTYILKEGKKNGEEWEYYSAPSKPKLCISWHEDAIQGQVKTWYENGIMESQREINENKKQGTSVAWYQNGDLMLIEEYENDKLLKGSYYKKGNKKPFSTVEEGSGTATLYTSEGIFFKKVSYEKGLPLLQKD